MSNGDSPPAVPNRDDAAPEQVSSGRSADASGEEPAAVLELAAPTAALRPKLPGPGLPECVAWTLGALAAQIVGTILVAFAGLVSYQMRHGGGSFRWEGALDQPPVAFALAGSTAILLVGWLGVVWRHAPRGLAKLGFRAPSLGHLALILAGVFPLSLLCGEIWASVVEWFPGVDWGAWEGFERIAQAPWPLVVLAMAILPPIGEELLFRGVLGRGLLARWGLWRGMVLTSVLFGIMHLAPAHVLSVIPVGFAFHYVYYTTRSFWCPMFAHFATNLGAAAALKFGAELPESVGEVLVNEAHLPLPLMAAAGGLVAVVGALFWQTRVRYVLPDGAEWSPGYATAGAPPEGLGATPVAGSPGGGALLLGAAFLTLFWLLLWNPQIWR